MKSKFFLAFTFALVLSAYLAFASPYFFKGVAHVNGSLAPNGTIIEAFIPFNATNPVSSVTIGEGQLAGLDPGKYVISFEATSGDVVSFKVNRIALIAANVTNTTNQTLGTDTVTNNFNLSINKSANTLACTFAVGCTGGFCVHSICRSASTFCGDAFCDSGESCSTDDSACGSGFACTSGCVATAAASTSSGGGGGGGGGGGPSLPSTTETVNKITADTPLDVKITETKLPVTFVELTSKTDATNIEVKVKEVSQPSGTGLAISSDAGKIYKYLEITVSTVTLSKAKIKFKVPKTWFTSNSIDPNTVALSKLVGTAWTKLPTTKVSETDTDVLYEAETAGFSTFVITGAKTTTPPVFAVCGNNVLETGEECDELQLAGQTCASKGFESGTLKCTACRFDTSGCTGAGPAPPSEKPAETPVGERPPLVLPPVTDVGGIILIVVVLAVLLLGYKFFMKKRAKEQ